MTKLLLPFCFLLMLPLMAFPQIDDSWLPALQEGWLDQSDPDTFRKQAKQSYRASRDSINARYVRALAKKWKTVEVKQPESQPSKPKPKEPPVAQPQKRDRKPIEIPVKLAYDISWPLPEASRIEPRIVELPEIGDEESMSNLTFYGTDISFFTPDRDAISRLHLDDIKEHSVAEFWQSLVNSQLVDYSLHLYEVCQSHKFSGWETFRFVLEYVKMMFPDNDNVQVIAAVFIMSNMGYDVTIANYENRLAILISSSLTIYNTLFINLSNGDKDVRYYIYFPNNQSEVFRGNVITYPDEAFSENRGNGKYVFSYGYSGLPNLAYRAAPNKYSYTSGGKKMEVEVNANLMDFFRDYPQTEYQVYVNYPVSEAFARKVDNDFHSMIAGMDTLAALQTLLTYMHYGFDYSTDGDQFGYEKAFFCEENFFYPKNDCEDRAILFSYLVRRLLGLEVLLVRYEGHVGTAVRLPDNQVKGDYLEYNGKRYTICDPTYIGATIGQSMDEYKGVSVKLVPCMPVSR